METRVNRAVGSILENERLTADLDDMTAQALFDWGVGCAQMIAESTAGMDDGEAEYIMYPRLRATRQLMRRTNRWVAHRGTLDSESADVLLDQITELAVIAYGAGYKPPDSQHRDRFMRVRFEYADDPPSLVVGLRALIEGPRDVSAVETGGDSDETVVE